MQARVSNSIKALSRLGTASVIILSQAKTLLSRNDSSPVKDYEIERGSGLHPDPEETRVSA
jgi:hypothetical protein